MRSEAVMTYDDWKLETPEDDIVARDRFMRKLLRQQYRDPDEARDDHYEECKADYQRTGGDDE